MLRSMLFFTYFWLSMLLATPICALYLLLRLVGLGGLSQPAFQALIRLWAGSLNAVTGAKVRVEGLERVPAKGPLCLVGNHQGNWDIVLVLALIPRTVGFVAKSQALYMPLVNLWITALDSVFIDRGNARKAGRSIERGVAKLKAGKAIMIFPEGTRSRGPAMGAFRPGAFKLATKAGAPILPVTIDGSFRMWEEKLRIGKGEILFKIHEPIPTADLGPAERKLLPERVRSVIAGGLGR